MLAVLVLAGGGSSSFAQGTEALRIEVTLDEYSFFPDPLRIPAGREVTLVIRNVGRVSHEFMAGREPEGNDFRQDLFGGLHVNIEEVDRTEAGHAHQADTPSHAEENADDAHAHGEGHEHGTMVEARAGQTFVMTFTLPEDRRGEWTTGCFLSGHYEAGMHGTLIVE
ncbi:MAG: hypothetical protein NZ847_11805 [Acidobacteria bacterium]|nr:hypothetical protein [Acidobacteriota bacterium]